MSLKDNLILKGLKGKSSNLSYRNIIEYLIQTQNISLELYASFMNWIKLIQFKD